jgi:hypothetical protein
MFIYLFLDYFTRLSVGEVTYLYDRVISDWRIEKGILVEAVVASFEAVFSLGVCLDGLEKQ